MQTVRRDAHTKQSVSKIKSKAMLQKRRIAFVFNSIVSHFKSRTSTLLHKTVTALAITVLFVPGSVLVLGLNSRVVAAESTYINFQARILQSSGALVPDGTYHIEFKLYDVSTGGSALWTETRSPSTNPSTERAVVKNGYVSVRLGAITSFPTTINWDQQLYLGMNIGGTAGVASWDGEMTPRFVMTSVPYAKEAGTAAGVTSNNTNATSTNSGGVSISTGNAAGATSNSGNLTVDTGTATGTAGTITIGATNASALTLGRTGLTVSAAGSLSVAQTLTVTGASTFNGNLNIANSSNLQIGGTTVINSSRVLQNVTADTSILTSGTLSVARGGTGASTFTTNGVLFGNGAGAIGATAAGTTGQCLVATTGAAPSWGSCGVSSQFTDGGTFTYLTDTAEDFVLGGSTVANSKFFFDVSASTLYLGTDNTGSGGANGSITLYSSGNGVADPTIASNSVGDLNVTSTAGTVVVGDGSGGIDLQLTNASDVLLGSKTFTAGAAYSNTDFSFVRTATGSTFNLTGNVLKIEDNSTVTTGSNTPTVLYVNQVNTAAGGFLINAAQNGVSKFSVTPAGATTVGGALSVNSTALFKPSSNSTTAFQIQPSASTTPVLNVDTTNSRVGIGTASPTDLLTVNGQTRTTTLAISSTGGAAIFANSDSSSAVTMVLGGTNGFKLGSQASEKLGFYGATPVVQASSTSDLRTALINIGILASGGATPLNLNGGALTAGGITNNGATVNTTLAITDKATGGAIGTAAATVDIYTSATINQTTAGQTITVPSPTTTTAGRMFYLSNIGTASFTLLGTTINAGTTASLIWTGTAWQFTGADGSGILNQNTADQTANFRISGTGRANTSFLTPTLDVATAGTLSVGNTTATAVTLGKAGITTTNAGALTVSQLLTGSLGLTVSGAAISLNNSSNFAVNIGTGTSNGLVTIGGGSGTFSLQTTNIDISNTGAITNATGFNGLVVTANTGVITTGTWNGTAIGSLYGGTGLNTSASTGVPYITSGTWSVLASLGDSVIDNNITVTSTGTVDWTALSSYPAACAAGSAVTTLGDTVTCTAFAPSTGGNYLAKNTTDTSSAAVLGLGVLYSFSNTSNGVNSGVLNINNQNNTGTALSVGSSAGTILDLNNTGVSRFSVTAAGATTVGGTLTVGSGAGVGLFTNNGATVNSTLALSNFATNSAIGTAAATVDVYTSASINQTTAGITLTVPTPTASTTYGRIFYLSNIGSVSFTLLGASINPGTTTSLIWANTNGGASWQFAGADGSGILNQNSTAQTANFQISGTGRANTSFLTPTLDVATAGTLSVGNTTATAVTLGKAGITTTNAGALTVSQLLTGSLGATISGAAISLNDSSNFAVSIAGGTSTGTVNIGTGTGIQTLNFGTGGTGAKTVTIGSTAGASTTTINSGTGALNIGTTAQNRSVNLGTGGAVQTVTIGSTNTTSTTNINAGSGGINATGSTNFTNSVAYKKGTDYSTTGTTNDANFGDASLIRLTGASAQTITGIANGRDGEILTIVNAAAQAAIIQNNGAGSLAANRITSGMNSDLTLEAGASMTLVYDSGASLWRVTGGGVSTTLQEAYTYSTSTEITLDSTRGGLTLRNATSDAITGNLFEVQNNAGTATFFGVTSSAVNMQDSSGNLALSFDSTTSELKIYENVSSPTKFARVYYASNTAVFAASSGTTQIGSSATGGNINLLLSTNTDVLSATKSTTPTAAYSLSDYNFTRNLNGTSFALTGSVLKVEDNSTFTTGSSAPNVLFVNQSNTSATGNLILAQTGGATTRFQVTAAGVVTLGSATTGLNITSAGLMSDLDGDITLNDQVDIGSATTGLQVTTAGLLTDIDGPVTIQDGIDINVSQNNPVNINTGTSTGLVTIGGGSGTFSLQTTNIDISSAGAISGVTGLNTSGGYTQTGTAANTFTGATTFSATGTALSVTNNASIGGTLTVTGAVTMSSTLSVTTSVSSPQFIDSNDTNFSVNPNGTSVMSFITFRNSSSGQTTGIGRALGSNGLDDVLHVGSTTNGLKIGSGGTEMDGIESCTVSVDFPSTANATTGGVFITMGTTTGCASANGVPTNAVIVGFNAPSTIGYTAGTCNSGFGCQYLGKPMRSIVASVTASTFSAEFLNASGAAVNPTAANWTIWYIDPWQ